MYAEQNRSAALRSLKDQLVNHHALKIEHTFWLALQ